jgi:hypothetical protein
MFILVNENSGEAVCSLSKKEIKFLEENMECEIEEDQEFPLREDDISHLILCDAPENLIHKLKTVLGDEDRVSVFWSRTSS